ncbi:CHAD domain-containing protein [Nitratireductor kimnyeongensis]|uniref:CHAD domain-containing protein n=1 Tax=Nitratireductor kimnyeongensis TaxID=430679 RepID=A0ABW0TBA9_9HYPH|nr:CYTH and CHAD domain-containing protein [Nitratireductor kimnyeongensis]QZZ35795.1 CHAD domain-containing protein [Nitratireductor kimnyeongensis]
MPEIELKLLLEQQQVPSTLARIEQLPPAIRRIRGTRQLHSLYFDTPDGVLRNNGITLRLRCTGTQWVQTVKLNGSIKGGLSRVTEIEGAIPEGVVSVDAIDNRKVRDHIKELVENTQLQTVAETRIRRTQIDLHLDDGTRAEVALDSGAVKAAGRSAPLHELEIELIDGQPAGLFRSARMILPDGALRFSRYSKAARSVLLAEHGYVEPPASPRKALRVPITRKTRGGEAAQEILQECLAQISANIEAVRQSEDVEGPHQLRIGLRRLRSALSLFDQMIGRSISNQFAKEARWLGHEVGRLRDLDVVLDDIARPFYRDVPQEPGANLVLNTLERHTRDVRADLRHTLSSERVNVFLLDLSELIQTGLSAPSRPDRKLKDLADEKLCKRWNHLLARAEGIENFTTDQKHGLRKALKKLRYAIEFLGPLYAPASVKRISSRLKALQAMFGSLNDVAVTELTLNKPPLASINDPSAQRAIGRLLGACETRSVYDWPATIGDWKRLRASPPFWKHHQP